MREGAEVVYIERIAGTGAVPVLTRVGVAASVPNGHPEVRSRVHYVTTARGGQGAVRELCDFILQAQGDDEAALAPYLR